MKRAADAAPDGAPMMKTKAKAAVPSAAKAPITKVAPSKAPITKVPPPNGKAPIAKTPPAIAKKAPPPVGAVAAAVKGPPPFAKRPPPPVLGAETKAKAPSIEPSTSTKARPPGAETKAQAPPPRGPASPPGSPEASGSDAGPERVDFTQTDPIYALIGELAERKVVNANNELDEERLNEYIERLMKPGVGTPKDWIEVWAAMNIPVEINTHAFVVQQIIQIGVTSEVGENVPQILAHLVTGHRAKVKAVEQALTTIFECGCDEKDCISGFLRLIFPKSPTSEWGWSRVGWSWKEWWGIADKVFSSLEPSGAFEALRSLLSAIETESGTYLPHQQIWDEKRLGLVRAALCRYGGLQEDELAAAVDISLS